jgi:hypothetical protein
MKTKETNIENMTTVQILWTLVYRHRVTLLIASNVSTFTIWLVQQGPVAAHNLMH